MALETTLTLYVGADASAVYTNYSSSALTTIVEMTGWTVVLDIRTSDTSPNALLSKTGVISGVFNSTPASNTQVCTFTITDDDTDKAIFPADEANKTYRFSIKRTDAGSEHPLAYGDCTMVRVTQT